MANDHKQLPSGSTREFFGTPVRCVVDAAGKTWLASVDVGAVLGFSEHGASVARRVSDDEKGVHNLNTPGGPQSLVCITEAAAVRIAISSRGELGEQLRAQVDQLVERATTLFSAGAAEPPKPVITAADMERLIVRVTTAVAATIIPGVVQGVHAARRDKWREKTDRQLAQQTLPGVTEDGAPVANRAGEMEARILAVLTKEPRGVERVATAAGVHDKTARRYLQVLKDKGLALHDPRLGWVAVTQVKDAGGAQ